MWRACALHARAIRQGIHLGECDARVSRLASGRVASRQPLHEPRAGRAYHIAPATASVACRDREIQAIVSGPVGAILRSGRGVGTNRALPRHAQIVTSNEIKGLAICSSTVRWRASMSRSRVRYAGKRSCSRNAGEQTKAMALERTDARSHMATAEHEQADDAHDAPISKLDTYC